MSRTHSNSSIAWSISDLLKSPGSFLRLSSGCGLLIYLHVDFAHFRPLKQTVTAENCTEGGNRLGQIRKLISLNLCLMLLVVDIATGGK